MRLASGWAFCSQRLLVRQSVELGGDEAHFGGKLHALFAQVLKIASELFIEEDDRFGAHETVLGAAEREHVEAKVASGLAQALAEGSGGIGDAGAVHVDKHFVVMGEAGEGF